MEQLTYNELKEQRDLLLKALKSYDEWADDTICRDPLLKKIREEMRKAIAYAEGK